MIFQIPGKETIEIKNVVLDFNGTIAIDGKLIKGIAELINELSGELDFHILTADTFGSVERELTSVNCKVAVIPKDKQDSSKLNYVLNLGKEKTLCVGNGRNDKLMMHESVLSIAVIQDEGVCVESLFVADIACHSIIDVFEFFKSPERLIATLRN